jgi:glycerophosphoryl diester phosphodiesterase
VHAAGMCVGTWITDDPATAVGLFRVGVDAVATNDPAAIALARREAFP